MIGKLGSRDEEDLFDYAVERIDCVRENAGRRADNPADCADLGPTSFGGFFI